MELNLNDVILNKNSVKELISAGADIHIRDEVDFTPILNATKIYNLTTFKLLMKAGANLKDFGNYENIITLCAWKGNSTAIKIAELALKAGADVNFQDISGETALYSAIKNDKVNFISLLLKYNPDIEIKTNDGHSIEDLDMYKAKDIIQKYISKKKNRKKVGKYADLLR